MKLQIHLSYTAGHYHGSEWPPSPGRLFQALVAASHRGAYKSHEPGRRDAALHWLEMQPPPLIRAPILKPGMADITNYVPNNDNKLEHIRAAKSMARYAMPNPTTITYEWPVSPEHQTKATDIAAMASLITYLGRTVDTVISHSLTSAEESSAKDAKDNRPLWQGTVKPSGKWIQPTTGFLDHLNDRYPRPVSAAQPDFSNSLRCDYTTETSLNHVRTACFSIHRLKDQRVYAFPPWAIRSITGLVRGAMIQWADQPTTRRAFSPDRLAQLVHGHQSAAASSPVDGPHFGVLALPTQNQGFKADGWLRNVAIIGWGVNNPDDEAVFDALAHALDHSLLTDDGQPSYLLHSIRHEFGDPLRLLAPTSAREWRSITPIVVPSLPRRGRKPESGLLRALLQQGFQPNEIESIASFTGPLLPKTLAAADYNIARNSYLARYPRCHAEIIFRQPLTSNGPFVVGAGRHVGLGLFVPVDHA